MKHDDRKIKSADSIDELKHANERRIEELLNINNRYVRTQRHLEENHDIASLDQLKHSFEIQKDREERMENLKNIISYDKHDQTNDVEALEKRIEYTDHYLQHNSANMEAGTLQNTNEKQEHRREQLKIFNE
ncbi:MAG: hypothetical protein K0R80_190 [Clostridia bacterium]|jgi:hypothetical protein|nr:hypothetical protein [Clostridia bacterium]